MKELSSATLVIGVLALLLFLPSYDEPVKQSQVCHEELVGVSRVIVCVHPFYFYSVNRDSVRIERIEEIRDSLYSVLNTP